MIKWLCKLLGLCQHKWNAIAETAIHSRGYELRTGTEYTLQCTHCGNIKFVMRSY